ncbi:DoxX family protein [Salinifilum ghardaiensis]
MLMRRLARPLLASIFIYGGIQELRNVSAHAPAASHLLQQTAGQIDETLPDQVPTDAETLARIDGSVKVGAGALLALGKFPRLSSLLLAANIVPTTLAAHAFWEHADAEQRGAQTIHFLKNLGVLGGLLASAAETGGKTKHNRCPRKAQQKAKAQHAVVHTPKAQQVAHAPKGGRGGKAGRCAKPGKKAAKAKR